MDGCKEMRKKIGVSNRIFDRGLSVLFLILQPRLRRTEIPYPRTMRVLGAVAVLNHVLSVRAFLSPISSVARGNTAPRTTFSAAVRRSHSHAARQCLRAASDDDTSPASPAPSPSSKPVLSFPGGGIFFWVRLGCSICSGFHVRC